MTACDSSADSSSPASRLLVTAICTIGKSSIEPVSTWGSTSFGRSRRLMASCTRCSVRTRSVPKAKLADTIEKPVLEVAFEPSRPGMPCTAVSIGVETSCSTISGAAPGYCVMTITCGKATEGMSSCLSVVSAIPPKEAHHDRDQSDEGAVAQAEHREKVHEVLRSNGRAGARVAVWVAVMRWSASQRTLSIHTAGGERRPRIRPIGQDARATLHDRHEHFLRRRHRLALDDAVPGALQQVEGRERHLCRVAERQADEALRRRRRGRSAGRRRRVILLPAPRAPVASSPGRRGSPRGSSRHRPAAPTRLGSAARARRP